MSEDFILLDVHILLLMFIGVFDVEGVCVGVIVELLLLVGDIDVEADNVANVDRVGLGVWVFDGEWEIDALLLGVIDDDTDWDDVCIDVDDPVIVLVGVCENDSVDVLDNDLEGVTLDVLELLIVGVFDLEGVLVEDSEKLVVLLVLRLGVLDWVIVDSVCEGELDIVGVGVLLWLIVGVWLIVEECDLDWDIPTDVLDKECVFVEESEKLGVFDWVTVIDNGTEDECDIIGVLLLLRVVVWLWLIEEESDIVGVWLTVGLWLIEEVCDLDCDSPTGVLDKDGVFVGVFVLDCVTNVFDGVGVLLFELSVSQSISQDE